MLNLIKQFFGVGSINTRLKDNLLIYRTSGVQNCIIIRNHFVNYPLFTYKSVYFQIWSNILDLLISKNHLELEGLLKIIALKANFKKGLSEKLKSKFTNYIPVSLPIFAPDFSKLNIHWLCGFINADGHFSLYIRKRSSSSLGYSCEPSIRISQDAISLITLFEIIKFLGFGNVIKDAKNRNTYVLSIASINNILLFIEKFK